ncbi:endonuclease III [Puia dinghuensis]|uniref:Endonuclease III n=1 Tax=Puia dinghuensis TaxID=1792502 RepID=A0A8J2UF44_9BACT|nr:endonuclease III [Puia dinghuensis]GGB09253.1 endonuclease III [Puia dinghuensis]
MTRKERFQFVLDYFSKHNPDAATELLYDDPYQLLVAVILSAQCTDKRVNMTTPAIFERWPDAGSMAKASFDELFPYIRSISYPNNKTKHLIGMAQMLLAKFGGQVPLTVEELVQLPGVGRKTANVITSVVDNQPNMAVDTHVFRVAARIGLTVNAKTPLATEKQLLEFIPRDMVHIAHHWLILHGRYVCVARTPKCAECGLQQACKYFAKHYGAAVAETERLPVVKTRTTRTVKSPAKSKPAAKRTTKKLK